MANPKRICFLGESKKFKLFNHRPCCDRHFSGPKCGPAPISQKLAANEKMKKWTGMVPSTFLGRYVPASGYTSLPAPSDKSFQWRRSQRIAPVATPSISSKAWFSPPIAQMKA